MDKREKNVVETFINRWELVDRILDYPVNKMLQIGSNATSILWSIPLGVVRRLCELQDRVRPYYEKQAPVHHWQKSLLRTALLIFVVLAILYYFFKTQESICSILLFLVKVDVVVIGVFLFLSRCADSFLTAAKSVRKLLGFLVIWAIYPAIAGFLVNAIFLNHHEFSGALLYGLWGFTWIIASALADPKVAKLANTIISGVPAAISLEIFIFSEKAVEVPVKILFYFVLLGILSELVIASMEYYRSRKIKTKRKRHIRYTMSRK